LTTEPDFNQGKKGGEKRRICGSLWEESWKARQEKSVTRLASPANSPNAFGPLKHFNRRFVINEIEDLKHCNKNQRG
jgi:hypothetical protein